MGRLREVLAYRRLGFGLWERNHHPADLDSAELGLGLLVA